ncbi:hypothetical protein ALC56_03802 [Trachymyrmex septentrionalis]|uniref:Uncharacterized protein n=1 Tax=Trachymyrmex septentrionalis TaxID=34720 RepID=A0A151JZ34_9HYME|nr:hypothetical protein ALC56_03802 [Trachymyrmex septentrionalis]
MCDKYPRLAMKIFGDALFIKMPSNTSINRAQRIVEQIDIRLSINCPCEIDSRSLTTEQRYTSIADHCHVSLRKFTHTGIYKHCTISATITLDYENYLHVSIHIIGLVKQYIHMSFTIPSDAEAIREERQDAVRNDGEKKRNIEWKKTRYVTLMATVEPEKKYRTRAMRTGNKNGDGRGRKVK